MNAGHNRPLVYRARSGSTSSAARWAPVGLVRGAAGSRRPDPAEPGDILVFYTDGLTEAENVRREPYGDNRLVETVRGAATRPAGGVMEAITHSVKSFMGAAPPFDDMTVVVLRYAGRRDVAERLQKLISQAGIASRRAAERLIEDGRVTVNGQVAHLGDKADPAHDVVMVDGQRLEAEPKMVYYLLYKPRGVISSNRRFPNQDRPIVRELVPHKGHLFSVGRLDADSEGLIILTNDGELANRLMHPRYEHTKTYHVLVEGEPSLKHSSSGATACCWMTRQPPGKVRVLSQDEDGTGSTS